MTSQAASTACTFDATGTVTVPVVLVNFTDTTVSHSPAEFQRLFFGDDPAIASGPGSLKDYYEAVSGGELTLSGGPEGVSEWVTANHSHDYYGQDSADRDPGSDARPGELVAEAIRKAAANGYDFAAYDTDGNGCVPVMVVHEGGGQEASSPNSVGGDIWSHQSTLARAASAEPVTVDGVTVNSYSLVPEIYAGDAGITTIGILAHELGHQLGLPDLYDTDGSSTGIGNWGLMGTGSWNRLNRTGDTPAHPTAWSKLVLGWAEDAKIGARQPGIIPPVEHDAVVYRHGSNPDGYGDWDTFQGEEYFLFEHRAPVGFDRGLPGHGMLVWHVDESVAAQNQNEWHKLLDLEAADGDEDMDADENRGDAFDPFPGATGTQAFSDRTDPSARWYDGTGSGIALRNISVTNGVVLFNSPQTRTLAANESAVYAVPVGMSVPGNRSVRDHGPIRSHVAWADSGSDLDVALSGPGGAPGVRSVGTPTTFERVRSPPDGRTGGWKLRYLANASSGAVTYRRTLNYPAYPLPTGAAIDGVDMAAGPRTDPNRVRFNLTVTNGGDPYTYGPFDPPTAANVSVTVGGTPVARSRLTVTEHRPHVYGLTVTPPDRSRTGEFDLCVEFTDEKLGVSNMASTCEPISYGESRAATIANLSEQWARAGASERVTYEERIADELTGIYVPADGSGPPSPVADGTAFGFATDPVGNATADPNGTYRHVFEVGTNATQGPLVFTLLVDRSANVSVESATATLGNTTVSLRVATSNVTVDRRILTRIRLVVRTPPGGSGSDVLRVATTLDLPATAQRQPVYTGGVHGPTGTVLPRHTTTLTIAQSIDDAIDDNDDGRIGNFEILRAIELWRDDSVVPGTLDETIGNFEVLELIELWRDGARVGGEGS
ncbi:MAG: M6 family metalloprotease domain-containing protein [Haloarculaceae archaeon]